MPAQATAATSAWSTTAAWPTAPAAETWVAGVGVRAEAPELREGIDPDDVSPGVLGFLFIFAAALVSIVLFLQMTSKVRRINHTDDPAAPPGARQPPSGPPSTDDAPPADDDPSRGGGPRP